MTSHPSPAPQEPLAPVNWLDLPADVSASIIRRLDSVEILTRVQYVCSTWRRICRDPSMWTSIDSICYVDNSNVQYDLSKLYRFAVDLSAGGLLDVKLDYFVDGFLRYITDRSKHLRRIRLGYCSYISEVEFIEVVEKIPVLEELDIPECGFSSEVVATLGRLCPLLYSLKVNLMSDYAAFAIAKHMSGLRHLHIFGEWLTKDGLIAILDGCLHLETLDLSQCFHVNLDGGLRRRCSERIRSFHGPNDSIDDHPFNFGAFHELVMKLASMPPPP